MSSDSRFALLDALGAVLAEDRAEKLLACRVLMRLCIADAELHPLEDAFLDATMARYGLGGDERSAIACERMVLLGTAPPDPGEALACARQRAAEPLAQLLDALPAAARSDLWIHLQHGAWADGKLVPAESAFLEVVARHFAK